ncbi:MAG: PAS domain-containing sensor histidine kinase [Anaerolineae bacterium]|nr:PAS domain-containing sensor histidine kinase [Anaerolineae bacterium]
MISGGADSYPLDENHFRTILEEASEGILIINEAGLILLINRRIEQLFGYDRTDLIGQSLEVLLPEPLRETHVQFRNGYFQAPYSRPMGQGMELIGKHSTGADISLEISLTYVRDATGILVLAFITDISERKRLEREMSRTENLRLELEKKHEQVDFKQRLLSFVSHEFRTPLTRIQLSIEMLDRYMDRIPPNEQRERIRTIQTQILELNKMLENMLTLSKTWTGKLQCRPLTADVVAFCQKQCDEIQALEGKNHLLTFQAEGVPPLVSFDPLLLQPIVSNLLSNAIKYSAPGSTIACSLHRDGDYLVARFRDEGIGIPPEALPHLFDTFYRAANSSNHKGTGLGLAIVKDCTEAHGGTVECQSEVGVGSTFIVRIPLLIPHTTF